MTLALFLAVGVIGLILLTTLASRWQDAAATSAMTAAAVICFVSTLIALLPVAIVGPRHPDWLMQAGLASIGLRMFLTLSLGAAYYRFFAPPKWAFMAAGIVCYLFFMAFETAITLRLVQKHWKPPARTEDGIKGAQS